MHVFLYLLYWSPHNVSTHGHGVSFQYCSTLCCRHGWFCLSVCGSLFSILRHLWCVFHGLMRLPRLDASMAELTTAKTDSSRHRLFVWAFFSLLLLDWSMMASFHYCGGWTRCSCCQAVVIFHSLFYSDITGHLVTPKCRCMTKQTQSFISVSHLGMSNLLHECSILSRLKKRTQGNVHWSVKAAHTVNTNKSVET